MTEMPPPPPPPPGAAPGGATVRIGDWVNEAIDRLKPAWTDYVVVGLAFFVVILVAFALFVIPGIIIAGPVMGGLYVYVAKKVLGMDAAVGDLFSGFKKFTDLILLWIIIGLPAVVVMILSVLSSMTHRMGSAGRALQKLMSCLGCGLVPLLSIFYIAAAVMLIFAIPLIMFKNLDAIAAIKESFRVTKADLVNFVLLALALWVVGIVGELGVIACVIGLLITAPLALCAQVMIRVQAYRDFFGLAPEDVRQYN